MAEYIQDIVNQIKGFINVEFGFCDDTGAILGCSDDSKVGMVDYNIPTVLEWEEDVCLLDEYVYQKYCGEKSVDFIVFIRNPDQDAINYINAISVCIINLKNLKESYNTTANFIRGVILGEIPSGEIAQKARELHLNQNTTRAVLLIRMHKANKNNAYEIIQSIFPNKNKDFIVILDELNIALVKEIKTEDTMSLDKAAAIIIEALNSEIMVKAYVGIGATFNNIIDLYRSFDEARTALEVGDIFYANKYIIDYNKLGLGRLIYKLPPELCKLFLNEVLKDVDEEVLDDENLLTINKLFENNLHVSETARQLYLHRNTLVYRLEKIQKATGLDLKKFDDSVVFKIGLLIREYLKKTP